MEYTGVESWDEYIQEDEQRMKDSLRQEELERCSKLGKMCVSCKHNKINTGEYFTCGATQCNKSNYPCKACAFVKWVNGGQFEDTIEAPPFPCEFYEKLEKQ